MLTQPGVSQQVKALETEVGERLLDRSGREVRVTPAGEIVELISTGGADLGVVTAPPHLDPAIEAAPLLEEGLLLALPPTHPKAASGIERIDELAGENAVLLAKPSVTRSVIDRGLREA